MLPLKCFLLVLCSPVSWKGDKGTKRGEMVCFWAVTVLGPPSKKLGPFWLNKLIEMNEEDWVGNGKRVYLELGHGSDI